jgi:hypothetical protein
MELETIRDALDYSSGKLPLVVGPSGAGKTVLLRRILHDDMTQRSVGFYYIAEYAGFRETLPKLLEKVELVKGSPAASTDEAQVYTHIPVIALDQFEQYLAYLRRLEPDKRLREQAWFEKAINEASGRQLCRFILSVRNEWYYDLRWLGDQIPAPTDCITVLGPRVDATEDITRVAVATRLEKVLHDEDIVESILTALGRGRSGSVLLLEAQIIGAVLERQQLLGEQIDLQYLETRLGGVEGAINSYFDGILAGAPDRRVMLKVLCALSVRTYFRRQETLGDLLDRLFEDPDEVRGALDYLVDQRLLVKRPTARYELAHDYLAEYFHQKSGSELDPTDRDNVLYHFEGQQPNMSSYVLPRAKRSEPGRGRFALAVIGPLILIMTLRLLDFGLPWPRLAGHLTPELLWDRRLFDVTYLPIYVAHLAWAIYVALFYDRFLARLDERFAQRLLSRFAVVNMALCVLTAVFIPYAWLLSIGWGGMVVGIKLIALSRMRALNSAARTRISLFGLITTVNLIFLSVLGTIGLWVSFRYVTNGATRNTWIYASSLFSVIMVYTCSVLAPVHVQRKGVSQLLGLLARSRSGVAPRVEM